MTRLLAARMFLSSIAVVMLCQCDITRSIDRADHDSWNANRIWKAAPGSRSDFIPADQPEATLVNTKGEWISDPQDGTRYFVPAGGTKKYPEPVIRGEAFKAMNRHSRGGQRARNSLAVALVPIHVATLGFSYVALHGKANSGGSSSSSDDFGSSTDTSWMNSSTSSDRDRHCDKHDSRHEHHKDCHKDDRSDHRDNDSRDDDKDDRNARDP